MGRKFVMGPDPGMDDPTTINLELSVVAGPGTITWRDENGFASGSPFNTVSIFGYVYMPGTAFNIANLVGVDGADELNGTSSNDLIVWEQQLSGLGAPRYLLPLGGVTTIDNFNLGDGDDIISLVYINDNNAATTDIPYSANAFINGGAGNDIVWSGHGNDVIIGGGGSSEILYGGAGNDTISGSLNAFNNIAGNSGDDELRGSNFNDGISGGTENDTIFGSSGNDGLTGEDGDDTIYGGSGADNAFGGAGNDLILGDFDNDVIDGDTGFLDSLFGGAGIDVISDPDGAKLAFGGTENDTLAISYAANWNQGVATLSGGAGADTITPTGAQNSVIDAVIFGDETTGVGDGADVVNARGSYNSVTASLGGGADTFTYTAFVNSNGARTDTVYGGAGADTINTGIGVDVLFGDAGNDILEGGANADTMYGGSEIDAISYSTSSAGITMGLTGIAGIGGDAQGDVAWTDVENLTGSQQADSLYGNASVNVLLGLGGDDTMEGLGGGDSLDGGAGTNWLVYLSSDAGVIVNLATGAASGGHAEGDTIANFQNLIGSTVDDTLIGSSASNRIEGRGGNDSIASAAGDDVLFGGGGNDTLNGQGGLDTLFGGNGDDLLRLTSNSSVGAGGIVVSGWDGEAGSGPINVAVAAATALYGDLATGGAGTDTLDLGIASNSNSRTAYFSPNSNVAQLLSGIEIIIVGTAADVINLTFNDGVTRTAYAENITISSGENGDVVFSGSGNDLLIGGRIAGASTNEGGDTLYGGAGNDRIIGDDFAGGTAGGGDSLYGGLGDDTVDAGVGNDTVFGGAGLDTLNGDVGNDVLLDFDGGFLVGAEGSDVLVLLGSNGLQTYEATGGKEDPTDGDDRVFVGGSYNVINGALGAGNDFYISSSTNSGTNQIDRVTGDSGNDLVSTWHGNDTVDGGAGADVIWGGAGVDTIFGGPDTDYLYGGFGDNDLLVGQGGSDFYYWARNDGSDVADDQDPGGTIQDNYILVFAGFETNPANDMNGDGFIDGNGVFETDGLYDNDGNDMVQIVDLDGAGAGTIYELTVLSGDGAGNVLTFDRAEITMIGLSNSDIGYVQAYQWMDDAMDPLGGRYVLIN